MIFRSLSLFSLQPDTRSTVERGISLEGSNLCGMAACIAWAETGPGQQCQRNNNNQESALYNWENLARQCDRIIGSGGTGHDRIAFPKQVALSCNIETAKYLPLCIQACGHRLLLTLFYE